MFLIAAFAINGIVTSCTLFGLDLQEEYPYEYSSKDPNIYMTAYEFVESRQFNDMSRMYAAINLTGLQAEYEKEGRTFMILNDGAFGNYMNDNHLDDIASADVETLKNYLMSNIANGEYTSLELSTVPMEMDILFKNDSTKLFLNRRPVGASTANKYQIHVNNFPGTLKYFSVRTSNIIATNGVIHVVNDYPEYRVAEVE